MDFFNHFIYSNKRWIRFLRPFLFWATDIVNYLLVISINTEITPIEVYRILLRMPLIMLATYFILYYLIPQFSKNPNRTAFYLWMVGILLFLGIGTRFYNYYILEPFIAPTQEVDFNVWDFRRILNQILQSMVVVSMAIAIKLIKNKTELQQKNAALAAEKKAAELSFLKAQMHPHFLFNILNTLYADAIQDTGKAEQIVLRLSNLLRFILEECYSLELKATFEDALSALDYLKVKNVDLIFLDIQIPSLSGIGFLKVIQKPLQVIITSAYSEYALEAFAFFNVNKPKVRVKFNYL
jgi:CheY-like chemotaxis protein